MAKGQLIGEFRADSLPENLSLPSQLRLYKRPITDYLRLNDQSQSLPELFTSLPEQHLL